MKVYDFSYVDNALQQTLENGSTPGVALLVDKGGRLLYRKAVGYAQIYPEQRLLTEETIFDVASLTKVVATTTAVMLLLRDGRIALDEAAQTYLPEFPHTAVTIKHLLSHTAGFPDHVPYYEDIQIEANQRGADFVGSAEAKQFILQTICDSPLLYPPGKFAKYSDIGFILLGVFIERMTGQSLDRFCDEMIFKPLGMLTTFFHHIKTPIPAREFAATERCDWRHKILRGEVHDENAFAMGGIAGHAGLFSTLDDLHRFMTALSRCYAGEDDMIPSAIVRQFFTRQQIVEGSTRALGWDTPSRNMKEKASGGTLIHETSVGHTGFTGVSIWLDLTRRLLIILLANRVHPSRHNQTFLNVRPKIHDAVVIATEYTL